MKKVFRITVFLAIAAMAFCVVFSGCTKPDDPEPDDPKTEEPEKPEPELTAEFDVTFKKEFINTIYPSFLFAASSFEVQDGEVFDFFKITVTPSSATDIRIVAETSKMNDETVITQKAISGKTEIIPSLKWKYDDLKHLSQAGTVDMTFVCYAGNKELGRETLKLNYRPVNECILYYSENDDEGNNVTPLLAAYVNENSPVIDAFMKEVLDADTLITAFTGYQAGADEVINQVDAIFTALRKKGIKYSDLAAGSLTVTDYLASQHVRFVDEVLTNTQANCVDGTVFFCSVLQKIGIHSMMVFEPNHVYLGYYTDSDKKELQILETTVVGDKDVSFQVATSINIDKFNENLDKYNNEDVFDFYFLVDVGEARKLINPIGR